jgi:3-hydroxyisobutyrate dehydrogenase-like beta-hydroxyacid dehydrogenase
MAKVGIVGVGNMGLGMAKNILKNGFELAAYDLREAPLRELARLGATIAKSPREVGEGSDFVFIMVLNGEQAKEVVSGEGGLLEGMKSGSTLICTATIARSDMIEIAAAATKKDIRIIDSPVSGGEPGARAGTLTMMVAAKTDVFERSQAILETVGKDIYHVGEEAGMGQTVKAALAVMVGATFASIFESLVLGVKAGVKPEILYQVFSTSVIGSFLFRNTTENIMARDFHAGSRIGTMVKDLGLARSLAEDLGMPLFVTAPVYELFQAGAAMNPEEDNWTIVKLLENLVGVEVKKTS